MRVSRPFPIQILVGEDDARKERLAAAKEKKKEQDKERIERRRILRQANFKGDRIRYHWKSDGQIVATFISKMFPDIFVNEPQAAKPMEGRLSAIVSDKKALEGLKTGAEVSSYAICASLGFVYYETRRMDSHWILPPT